TRDPDGAAALPDNSIGGRETKSGAPAAFLGSEERLKQVALLFLVHPDARIYHRDGDIIARLHAQLPRRNILRDLEGFGLDHELAPIWHGITSIHHQVHDDLLQPAGI